MASKKPQEGFEALYKRLEEMVFRLESGGLTLKEALDLYEEGMTLARRCQEILQKAELRVTKLRDDFSSRPGAVREEAAGYETGPGDEDTALE